MQDAQVPRHPRLIDDDALDYVIDRMLAVPEDFYDLKPSWITQDLEKFSMHMCVYV